MQRFWFSFLNFEMWQMNYEQTVELANRKARMLCSVEKFKRVIYPITPVLFLSLIFSLRTICSSAFQAFLGNKWVESRVNTRKSVACGETETQGCDSVPNVYRRADIVRRWKRAETRLSLSALLEEKIGNLGHRHWCIAKRTSNKPGL